MTDEQAKREVKKAKRFNYVVFAVFALTAFALCVWVISYKISHAFSVEKWAESPNERTKIVSDLISSGALEGKTRGELEGLLGDDTGRISTASDGDLVYRLGPERYGIDSEWLIISFEGRTFHACEITTD